MNSKKLRILLVIGLVVVIALAIIGFFTLLTFPRVPDDLNAIALSSPTYLLGDDGQIVKVLSDRETVPLAQVSPDVIHAFLALEDSRFYHHHGIDKKGLLRALLNNVIHFRVKQGASTITQQVAKALFFGYERVWSRKIREAFIALQLERQFPKDRILEAYINQIDFGSGVFGIELAAETYFGKRANELTLAESALIAGVPRWPARYNPISRADIARERQAFVLRRMEEEGYISHEQRQQALAEDIKINRINPLQGNSDYFVETIRNQVSSEYGGDAVNYGGLRIHTTMNARFQYEATKAVVEGLERVDEAMGLPPYRQASWDQKATYPQGALVAIDVHTGGIKALVGGRDFRRAPFNRALANNRHAGSAFKPMLYFAAFDRGIATPKTVYVDAPTSFQVGNQTWAPDNIDFKYQGPVVLKYALMKSINIISAKLIDEVTPEVVVSCAHRLGIESEMGANPSLALGATGVSPLEMAEAYATMAGGGIRHQPYFVVGITTAEGQSVEETIPKSQKTADPLTCYQMVDMLRGVVEGGTAISLRSLGFSRPCAGKTGTSNDYRDNWFVGFTPDLVIAVWVGFDDNHPMYDAKKKGMTGARSALPIFAQFCKNALATTPYTEFTVPDGIIFEEVDPRTGAGPMPGGPSLMVALKNYQAGQ